MKHTYTNGQIFLVLLLIITFAGVSLAAVQRRTGRAAAKTLPREHTVRAKGRQTSVDWYKFTGPDSDFTAQFPSKPKREEDAPGIIGMIRRYSATSSTHYFGIVYQDVGPAASDLAPNHEEDTATLLREGGHKVISVRRLSKNSTQMELWVPSRTPGKFLHRIDRTIVSHDRVYTLGCSSRIAEQEVDKAACRRFFDSFHIIGAPQ